MSLTGWTIGVEQYGADGLSRRLRNDQPGDNRSDLVMCFNKIWCLCFNYWPFFWQNFAIF
jgi:hypothetical protein